MNSRAIDPVEESQIVEIDDDHVTATAFNMVFLVWRHRTLHSAYEAAMELVRQLGLAYPEGVGVMQVVEVDALPPDAETRKLFGEFLHLPPLKHFSVTHDGTGFKAAAIRAVVTGTHTFARAKCAHSVHSNVSDAALWHVQAQRKLKHFEPVERYVRVAQALRAKHRQQFP